MLRSLLLLSASASLLLTSTVNADVYMYKDAKGNVQYTDKPATLPAERLNVQSKRTDTVAAQERQNEEMKRIQDADKARQQSAAKGADQQQATQLSAKDKAERCTKARERYDSYMNSQRLYEQLPDGERRYLTSEELDESRASAKASMDVMCQ